MSNQLRYLRFAVEAGKATVTASLCVLMAVAPAMAEEGAAKTAPAAKASSAQKLTEHQKTLHALNRLTFGPRPGDVAAAEKMGLHAWFEQQLNPKSIDDSTFQAMLTQFPAMELSQEALMKRFPSPQMLKNVALRNRKLPSDPSEHAIYANGIVSYQRQFAAEGLLAGKKGKSTGAEAGETLTPSMDGTAAPAMNAGQDMAAATKASERKSAREEYTGEDAALIVALPPDERMAKILAMTPEQGDAFRRNLSYRERGQLTVGLSPQQNEVLMALQGPIRVVSAEALESRLLRDVYSDRQLEAVMTDFWLNHFSVYVRKSQNEPYMLGSYERETIRPHALGKFEDLLVATAQSPAMMMYLDNWQSVGPNSLAATRGQQYSKARPDSQLAQLLPKGINENYARELMELHTVGVQCEVSKDHTAKQLDRWCGPGYTQADITNVARVLTGWTIDKPYGGGTGGFIYDENRHDTGPKVVMGQPIAPNGEKEGLAVLHTLATSPATAVFISHKLAVRFVSDNPPKALEYRMASTFMKTGGDIKEVLRTMFDSPEFWSPAVYRAKVKTPIEFVASALRASGATVNNAIPLVQAMDRLGMPIYGMQTPNGYSWTAEPWVSTTALVSRMNFALVMSGGKLPGTKANWPKLLGDTPVESAAAPSPETEKQLELLILGQPAAQNTRTAVLQQAAKPGQVLEAQKNLALGENDGQDNMMAGGGKGRGRGKGQGGQRSYSSTGASMTDLASNSGNDGPVATMAGLLLGSPEFQRR